MPTEEAKTAQPPIIEEMAAAGIFYGRRKAKTNPKMRRFIFTNRNGFEIFDLPKTLSAIEAAANFLAEVVGKRGLILLVGTEPAARECVQSLVGKFGYPFVPERWLGGT